MLKVKKFLCILTACSVLLFGTFFLPRQKAEGLAIAIGTVAAVAAIGLMLYGVCTTTDTTDVPDDSFLADAGSTIATSCGFGNFVDPSDLLFENTVTASVFLAASAALAADAYSTGVCSTSISGSVGPYQPVDPVFDYLVLDGAPGFTFQLTHDGVSHVVNSTNKFIMNAKKSAGTYLSFISYQNMVYAIYTNPRDVYFYISSDLPSGGYISYQVDSVASYCRPYTATNGVTMFYQPMYPTADYTEHIYNTFAKYGYTFSSEISPSDFIEKFVVGSLSVPSSPGISADVAKPVIPGACDVFNSSKSLDNYHVDSPGNDVLDFGNLLEKTGCETLDDVVSKVNDGELTVADVQIGLGTWPYVDVGTETGEIATPDIPKELTRPVALDQSLAIPADIAATDTYQPLNPPADKNSSNRPNGAFTLPLYKFFPFCLPWDIYQVLSVFDVEPKAPVITLPLGSFFSDIPGVDSSTTDYVTEIDLGDDQFAKWFLILRNLEKIGIIIGFVLISRYLIHGGD